MGLRGRREFVVGNVGLEGVVGGLDLCVSGEGGLGKRNRTGLRVMGRARKDIYSQGLVVGDGLKDGEWRIEDWRSDVWKGRNATDLVGICWFSIFGGFAADAETSRCSSNAPLNTRRLFTPFFTVWLSGSG